MNAYIAEFIGTAILVTFGNGVVANVTLSKTKGNNGGWIVITAGWALAVFVGVFTAQAASGAHLNPAVTVAMAQAGKLGWGAAAGYMAAQLLGAIVGGTLVFLFYREHFKATPDAGAKLGCFCTGPNIRSIPQSFFCECVGTFMLVFPVFLMTDAKFNMPGASGAASEVKIGLGALGALPVGLLVFAIGLSLGGVTGYAINPARDFGPRLAHALLPVPGKRDSDWSYAWVPVLGPLVGGVLAAIAYSMLK